MKNKRAGKIKTAAGFFLSFVVLAGTAALVLYLNIKVFTVNRIFMPDGKEVFLMGTFHSWHFKRYANYSIQEMCGAIKNINPDLVLIEAREENYAEYGVVDGPVDMCVAYGLCADSGIPVEMIDWWVIDSSWKENTTTPERDDHIHANIMQKMNLCGGQKILIVCGWGHLNAQTERLIEAGGKKQRIPHAASLFKTGEQEFKYPDRISELWEARALFYGHTVPKIVQSDETLSVEIKAQWPEDSSNAFYMRQMKWCRLFDSNALYLPRDF